jgi:hypothetical protein
VIATKQTRLRELTQIALFGAVGFIFYLLTAAMVDSLLPLLGCLIRPIIYLTLISSRFHFRKRELIYISLISAFLYAMVVPCFVNYASVPVSLIFVSISTLGRSKMNPFIMTLAASISAFIALAILFYFFSPKKSDLINLLKASPIVIITGIIIGLFRWKFGKVSCVGCDLCDRPEMLSYSSRIKAGPKHT